MAWAPWSWSRFAVRLGRGEQASEPEPAVQPPSLLPGDPDHSPIPSPTPGLCPVRWDCRAQALRALECAPGRRACHMSWGWAGGRLCLVGLHPWSPARSRQSWLVTHSLLPLCWGPPRPPCSYIVAGARAQGRATVTTHSILGYFAASEGDLCQGHRQASRPPPSHILSQGSARQLPARAPQGPGGIREP